MPVGARHRARHAAAAALGGIDRQHIGLVDRARAVSVERGEELAHARQILRLDLACLDEHVLKEFVAVDATAAVDVNLGDHLGRDALLNKGGDRTLDLDLHHDAHQPGSLQREDADRRQHEEQVWDTRVDRGAQVAEAHRGAGDHRKV